jgi:hypothetical protein
LSMKPITPEDDIPFHPTVTFSDSMLTEEIFRQIWAEGHPLVVKGVLDKFHIKWTPQYFIEKYSDHGCMVVDCVTEAKREVTVGWFFAMFGKYSERDNSRIWKLKDWPPSTDFKSAFPELYEDFARAVPIPSYCRRDGVLNIASHFPSNAVGPDLGTLRRFLLVDVEANWVANRPKNVQCVCHPRHRRFSGHHTASHGHGGCREHNGACRAMCRRYAWRRKVGPIPCRRCTGDQELLE